MSEERKTRQKKSPEVKRAEFAKKINETGEKMITLFRGASKLQLSDTEKANMKSYIENVCRKCLNADTPKNTDFVSKIFGPK